MDLTPTFSLNFIRGIHLGVSVLGATLILLTWSQHKQEKELIDQDWGWMLIAFALLSWGAIDLFKILRSVLPFGVEVPPKILSALNNGFFLAALPYFLRRVEKVNERYPFVNNGVKWAISVLLVNVFLIILYLVFGEADTWMGNGIAWFDSIYSTLTMGLVGLVFTRLFKRDVYGNAVWILSAGIFIGIVGVQLNYFPIAPHSLRPVWIFLQVFTHIAFILLLFLLLQQWIFEHQLQREMGPEVKAPTIDPGFSGEKIHKDLTPSLSVIEQGTYIKFFRGDQGLGIELTIQHKGIIGAQIYSSLKREYKDLLRFAVYKQIGKEVKAYGGIHKDFGGDIYKSVSDIRKKWLNPALKNLGLEELQSNELIVQKIKRTGIYELACLPDHIEIDRQPLEKLLELKEILSCLGELKKEK